MKKYKKYKKNSKNPKAEVGTALLAAQLIPSAIQLGQSLIGGRRARKAERQVDKSQLKPGNVGALTELYNEPISQSYLEKLDESSARDFATSMGSVGDDRTKVGLYNRAQALKQNKDLQVLGLSEQARQKALMAKGNYDARREMFDAQMTMRELQNIGAAKGAAQQSLMNVAGDVASAGATYADFNNLGNMFSPSNTGIDAGMGTLQKPTLGAQSSITSGATLPGNFKKGGKIEAGEGGVTEGECDHDSNPIEIVQDGEKKGEMTGGELIVPPSDVDDIRKALDSGDAEQAMDLMRALVAKYDDNAMEVKGDEAQDGATITEPVEIPPLDLNKSKEIIKAMKDNSQQVRNLGELPFDEDPTNPAGLLNFIKSQISFDIDSNSIAEIDFIKNYRDFMVEKEGRTDSPNKNPKKKSNIMQDMKSKYNNIMSKGLGFKKGGYIPKKIKY